MAVEKGSYQTKAVKAQECKCAGPRRKKAGRRRGR
jgi:hypothetical protein